MNKEPNKIILFISGPMAKYADDRYNYHRFEDAATRLRSCGYNVLSPHEHYEGHEPGDESEEYYIKDAFYKLLQSDGVALIDDYWDSEGSIHEVILARWCKIPSAPIEHWIKYAVDHVINVWKENHPCPPGTSGQDI